MSWFLIRQQWIFLLFMYSPGRSYPPYCLLGLRPGKKVIREGGAHDKRGKWRKNGDVEYQLEARTGENLSWGVDKFSSRVELPGGFSYFSKRARRLKKQLWVRTQVGLRWLNYDGLSHVCLTSIFRKAKISRAAQFYINHSPPPLLVNIWLKPHSDTVL